MTMPSAAVCLPLLFLLAQDSGPPRDPQELLRPFWKPVSLHLKDTSSRTVFESLFTQAGQTLELPETWEPKAVSLDLVDASFWQAVDAVCKADGGIRMGTSTSRGQRGLVAEPWIPLPVCYAGPLRFSIADVSRVEELTDPERTSRTDLEVRM